MDDIEEIPVETAAGQHPPASVADRLIIGLASAALLGGVLIAAGNFLAGFSDEPVAASSPSPPGLETARPSRTPRPSPTPRPPREVSVVPESLPSGGAEPAPVSRSTWIVAIDELALRSAPLDVASVTGRMRPGEVAMGDEQVGPGSVAGWINVFLPQPGGWVRVVDERGRPLAETYPVDDDTFGGTIQSLAAGPGGFVAQAWLPTGATSYSGPAFASSADGEAWRSAVGLEDLQWEPVAVAWGPSRWLAVARTWGMTGEVTWIWESADGVRWTPVGSLRIGSAYPLGLVASDAGYLMVAGSVSRRGDTVAWFSPDGLTWRETTAPIETVRQDDFFPPGAVRALATPRGFVVWNGSDSAPAGRAQVAFSANGRTWSGIAVEEGASLQYLGVANERLLGLGRDASGAVRTWTAALTGGPEMRLERSRRQDLAFDGSVVTALVSDGQRAVALGYQRGSEVARAWVSDGVAWQRLSIPDEGFGIFPRLAAMGPAGVVVAGARPSEMGENPILWHLRPDGSWAAEARPLVAGIAPPTPDECGLPPDSAVEFAVLAPGRAVACFGDEETTFRAFSVDCDGCIGTPFGEGPREPAWLAAPHNGLLLQPLETAPDEYGWWREALVDPELEWRDEWDGAWLEVTGHYDDPEATSCDWQPGADAEPYYHGRVYVVLECRQRFVVTEVTVVAGP